MSEAATSSILPTFVVVIYRAVFAIFLVSTFLYYQLKGPVSLHTFTRWSHLGLALSFSSLSAISLIFLLTLPASRSSHPSNVAFLIILFFQVFASAALFLDVVYWALLYSPGDSVDLGNLSGHALNLVCVVLELVLSLRMNFKLMYTVAFIVYVIMYLVFLWIRYAIVDNFVYDFLDYRDKSAGTVVLYYLGTTLWALVASIIMVLFSRLNRLPCIPGRYSQSNLASSDSDESKRQANLV